MNKRKRSVYEMCKEYVENKINNFFISDNKITHDNQKTNINNAINSFNYKNNHYNIYYTLSNEEQIINSTSINSTSINSNREIIDLVSDSDESDDDTVELMSTSTDSQITVEYIDVNFPVEEWKIRYEYLSNRNCFYVVIFIVRNALYKENGKIKTMKYGYCIKIGKTDKSVYERLLQEIKNYDLVWCAPLAIVNCVNPTMVESEIKKTIKRFKLKIGFEIKNSLFSVPREIYTLKYSALKIILDEMAKYGEVISIERVNEDNFDTILTQILSNFNISPDEIYTFNTTRNNLTRYQQEEVSDGTRIRRELFNKIN